MLKCFKAFEILGKVCLEVKLEADLQTWRVIMACISVSPHCKSRARAGGGAGGAL